VDPWKASTAVLGSLCVLLASALAWSVLGEPPPPPSWAPATTGLNAGEPEPVGQRVSEPLQDALPPGQRGPEPLVRPPPLNGDGSRAVPAWVEDPDAPLPTEILDRARTQLREERLEARADAVAAVRDVIDAFVVEEGLDPSVADTLQSALDRHQDRIALVRAEVEAGELDRREAVTALRDSRGQLLDDLEAPLGADKAGALQDRIREEASVRRGGETPPPR
jgi:hypothetical protein